MPVTFNLLQLWENISDGQRIKNSGCNMMMRVHGKASLWVQQLVADVSSFLSRLLQGMCGFTVQANLIAGRAT
ncbi:hypothetical protein [Mucilaginibacter sp. FT3.2]|uniref:hypothetical protein n=1 Tax=Mucilaginibacter sp. FT3.2 TaxID=2723090 RepID=UPI00161FE8F9|nr:hypothetical protein [Mucilaginibacter sp. FT3.2]MBB6234940.1 hypothetical protein [Mucilaginibacter sp. FT3.2]